MQSRKGIKVKEDAWVWGAVDMCESYPDCEYSDTYLIGKLHFDENLMVFEVVRMPTDLANLQLAADEEVSYRLLAKRDGEGSWRRMNWYSNYENRKIGLSENMDIEAGDFIRIKPPVGYIEDYNRWILERVVTKAGKSVAYGAGDRLLDIKVSYAELNEK